MPVYDTVLIGGRVMDPESGTDRTANVGISDGVVEAITGEPLVGEESIDARGLVVAQAALGSIYSGGAGVSKNYVTAYLWWSLAKSQGHKIAEKNLEILISRMMEVEKEEGDALVKNWRRKP